MNSAQQSQMSCRPMCPRKVGGTGRGSGPGPQPCLSNRLTPGEIERAWVKLRRACPPASKSSCHSDVCALTGGRWQVSRDPAVPGITVNLRGRSQDVLKDMQSWGDQKSRGRISHPGLLTRPALGRGFSFVRAGTLVCPVRPCRAPVAVCNPSVGRRGCAEGSKQLSASDSEHPNHLVRVQGGV